MNRFLAQLRAHRTLLFILVVSFSLKGFLLSQASIVNRDATVYIAAAQKFSQGLFSEGAQYYPMPLYPLVLALAHKIVPDWELSGQLLNLLFLGFSTIPLYILTYQLFDKFSANSAALIFSLLPIFNEKALEIIRDPLFLLLVLSAFALLVYQLKRPSIWGLCILALLLVLATLVRIEGVILVVMTPFLLLWQMRHRLSFQGALRVFIVILLSISLLACAVGLITYAVFETRSRFPEVQFWIENLFSLQIFNKYQALMEQLKMFQHELPGGGYSNNLIEITRHYAPLVYVLGLIEMFVIEILPSSILALYALKWRSEPFVTSKNGIIFLPGVVFLLINLLYCVVNNFTDKRYLWLPIALSIPLIGLGIHILWGKLHSHRVVLIFVMAIIFVTPAVKTLGTIDSEKDIAIRQAGEWLQQYDPEKKKKILYNDRRLSFYGNRVEEIFQFKEFDQFLKESSRMKDTDLAMFVVDEDFDSPFTGKNFREKIRFEGQNSDVIVLENIH